MQEQKASKVTLYLPPDLHRQLKVQSALDGEPMSAIAERAIDFYLSNSEVVNDRGIYGQTHRIHSCPSCAASLIARDGELRPLTQAASSNEADVLTSEVEISADNRQPGEGELVAC